MWRSLNYRIKVFCSGVGTVSIPDRNEARCYERSAWRNATGWEPGAADKSARLESSFAVIEMVDYHVYHFCSYTSGVGVSAISLVFRKAMLQVTHRGVYSKGLASGFPMKLDHLMLRARPWVYSHMEQ